MPSDTQTTLQELKDAMLAFARERDWLQFHAPKNLCMGLSVEAAELTEHFLWCDLDESRDIINKPDKREAIKEELADVLLYVMQFANVTGIDLAQAAMQKLEKNRAKYPADKFRGRSEKYNELP